MYYTGYRGDIKIYPENCMENYAAYGIVSKYFSESEAIITSIPIGDFLILDLDPRKEGISVRADKAHEFLRRLASLFAGKSCGYLAWQGEEKDDYGYWGWDINFDWHSGLKQNKQIIPPDDWSMVYSDLKPGDQVIVRVFKANRTIVEDGKPCPFSDGDEICGIFCNYLNRETWKPTNSPKPGDVLLLRIDGVLFTFRQMAGDQILDVKRI